MKSTRRMRPLRAAATAALAILAAGAGYFGYLQWSDNFHTVIAGQLYRSAQPTAAEISEYAKDYGIRSIVNLRGANPGKEWYDNEIKASRKAGIGHVDFRMSAHRILSPARAREIMAILRKVPKPVLIHCAGGADRAGLVVSLYLAKIAKAGENRSEDALSIVYGHISIPFISEAYAMDRSWERLEPSLGYKGS